MAADPTPPSAEPSGPNWRVWLLAARPKTLGAAVAPVLVGTAMAIEAGALHLGAALCALLGAVFIQIGTNFSNDYLDFLKGADTDERKGPTRATQAGLVSARAMKRATAIAFGLAVVAGVYLIVRGGWPILVVGVVSIACGVLYTAGRFSLAYLGLADLFVLVFFGPVAVGGTYYVQALALPSEVLVAGLGPGLLATAILLVNNIRDVREDRLAGKQTLIVRAGRRVGIGLYAVCVVGAVTVVIGLVIVTGQHWAALSTVLVLPVSWPLVHRLASETDPRRLNPLLGETGRLLLLFSVLFAVGWNL